jgi:tetratricopeptide (TPR) repeat protein
LDKYEEAIKCYDKAIELKPDYADAWFEKGKALKEMGYKREAKKSFEKANQFRL